MKRLLLALSFIFIVVSSMNLLAQQSVDPPYNGLFKATEEIIYNEAGEISSTRCIKCNPNGTCLVLSCL